MQTHASRIQVLDAVKALAFVGDLSMGQPIDHSVRTATLAAWLAAAMGWSAAVQGQAYWVSLLRWSGCTANAPEFARLMGDDVDGRRDMLSQPEARPSAQIKAEIQPLAEIHCEVSGDVARTLGMPAAVERPLREIFESFDGQGQPQGLRGADIPVEVFLVAVASDLEIFARVHGLPTALRAIAQRADARYPAALAACAQQHAGQWLQALDPGADAAGTEVSALQDLALQDLALHHVALRDPTAPLELIADVIDLKLPWLTGFSRQVALAATRCATTLGWAPADQGLVYRAALIHGMGRAAVPNTVWDTPGPPSEAHLERLRLVPYWTARAARRIGSLGAEADIASFVDERLDGSGAFRGAAEATIGPHARVLAVAAQWVTLRTARPGRPALSDAQALAQLQREAALGRLDAPAVAALAGGPPPATPPQTPTDTALLSSRETEVLRRISHGDSNKEAARALDISPSTVRTHLENVFRKLECGTRAAATLKAMTLGLI